MIAVIRPIEEMPGHFAADLSKVQAWEDSMGRWSLEYGSITRRSSHPAAHFGFVRTGVTEAWCWCEWLQKHPNKEMLRLGLRVWRAFVQQRPWTLYALCNGERERNFA